MENSVVQDINSKKIMYTNTTLTAICSIEAKIAFTFSIDTLSLTITA